MKRRKKKKNKKKMMNLMNLGNLELILIMLSYKEETFKQHNRDIILLLIITKGKYQYHIIHLLFNRIIYLKKYNSIKI